MLGADAPPRAFYLHLTDAGCFALDLRNSRQNGPLTCWLAPESTLHLEPYTIAVERPGTCAAPLRSLTDGQMSRPWPVVQIHFQQNTKETILRRGLMLVGRSASCHLRLRDPRISTRHCLLHSDRGRLWVIDLLSSNGTHVGDCRIDVAEVPLGATIKLGKAQIEFTRLVESHGATDTELTLRTAPQRHATLQKVGRAPGDHDQRREDATAIPAPADERTTQLSTSAGLRLQQRQQAQGLLALQLQLQQPAEAIAELSERLAFDVRALARRQDELERRREELERRELMLCETEAARSGQDEEIQRREQQLDERAAEIALRAAQRAEELANSAAALELWESRLRQEQSTVQQRTADVELRQQQLIDREQVARLSEWQQQDFAVQRQQQEDELAAQRLELQQRAMQLRAREENIEGAQRQLAEHEARLRSIAESLALQSEHLAVERQEDAARAAQLSCEQQAIEAQAAQQAHDVSAWRQRRDAQLAAIDALQEELVGRERLACNKLIQLDEDRAALGQSERVQQAERLRLEKLAVDLEERHRELERRHELLEQSCREFEDEQLELARQQQPLRSAQAQPVGDPLRWLAAISRQDAPPEERCTKAEPLGRPPPETACFLVANEESNFHPGPATASEDDATDENAIPCHLDHPRAVAQLHANWESPPEVIDPRPIAETSEDSDPEALEKPPDADTHDERHMQLMCSLQATKQGRGTSWLRISLIVLLWSGAIVATGSMVVLSHYARDWVQFLRDTEH